MNRRLETFCDGVTNNASSGTKSLPIKFHVVQPIPIFSRRAGLRMKEDYGVLVKIFLRLR